MKGDFILTQSVYGLTLIASVGSSFLSFWPIVLAADPGAGGGFNGFLYLFVPLLLVWYFLIIHPQQRQRKKTQEMLSNLKTGDRVVTTGGIYGTIAGFRDSVVQLQITNQVRIDVARSAITGLALPEGEGKTEPSTGGEAARREAVVTKGKKP